MYFGDVKVTLEQDELPRHYYNILPDLPRKMDPPLGPDGKPVPPQAFEGLFTKEAVRLEFSDKRRIEIPEEVIEAYLRLGRPTPLYRAARLEKYLKTPARIYFKREDMNPCGSHKPNTAIPQAYYAMREGVKALSTETGAGQWGTALSYACMLFGLDCRVFMVKASYEQKPYRRTMMKMFGAKVFSSPSDETEFGKKVQREDPGSTGSLGIAISEAIESAVKAQNTKYSLGSVLNHVLTHQSVIGQEAMAQFRKIDETPDVMMGCVGGGSNFAGFTYPFIGERLKGKNETEFVAVEPADVPSITKGEYRYDHGDTAGMTPLMKMYTLGHCFKPSPIHAGGLRYHGMAPSVSLLVDEGIVRGKAYAEAPVFDAAYIFAKTEGIIPAPESSHAIRAAIDEALACRKSGEKKVIAFNLSGHGLLDMEGFEKRLVSMA
jgi:tryptophan synthase beta chain